MYAFRATLPKDPVWKQQQQQQRIYLKKYKVYNTSCPEMIPWMSYLSVKGIWYPKFVPDV